MKNLYLIRHAKSSWKLPLDDHKRPLKKRWISDAIIVSEHLKNLVPKPDVLLTSDAKRASSTAIYFKKAFDIKSDFFLINKSLYDFKGKNVLSVIKGLNNFFDIVVIVGHNHALTSVANILGDIAINDLPTCGFVNIEFATDNWRFANYGQTKNIVFPRDLRPKKQRYVN